MNPAFVGSLWTALQTRMLIPSTSRTSPGRNTRTVSGSLLWYREIPGPSFSVPSMTDSEPYRLPRLTHPPRVIPSMTLAASE